MVAGMADRVSGIRLAPRSDPRMEAVVSADLVVDATGRSSRTPAWLRELGHASPVESRVKVDVGYASSTVRLDPVALGGDTFVAVGPVPDRPTGVFVSAIENGAHMVTVNGYGDQRPPSDREGYLRFVASVVDPVLADAIQTAEPVDARIAVYRIESNLWRLYDTLPGMPGGLLVVGDGLASFNPIYRQGMAIAAVEAAALQTCLEQDDGQLQRRFLRAQRQVVGDAWVMATGADLALPQVEGRRTLAVRFVNRYMARLVTAAADDPALATAFVRATGLIDRPSQLLRPAIAARVARHAVSGRLDA